MTRSYTTVAAGLSSPAANRPRSSEPAGVGHASSVGLRKVPLRLEAVEVRVECWIQRFGMVDIQRNLIQESVRGDRSVARIYDGGADDPDCPSVGATHVQFPFGAASIGFDLVVQLIGRLDDRRSVQAEPILVPYLRKYGTTYWAGAGGIHREPEVGDDPCAQDVIAEVPKRAVCGRSAKGIIAVAAVNGVAIGGEPPILPEVGRRDAGHRKTRRFACTHGSARSKRKRPAVGHPLPERAVGLEVADDVHHLDVAFVGDAGEEVLVRQEGNDGDEVCRRSRAIIDVAAGGGQDAYVLFVGIVGAASRVGHPVGLGATRGRAKLAEKPEALARCRIQLSNVDAVCGIEGIIEVAGRMVVVIHDTLRGGAGGGRKQQCQRREEEKRVLSHLHWLVLLYPKASAATMPRCRMTNSQPPCLTAAARDSCRAEAPRRWIRR